MYELQLAKKVSDLFVDMILCFSTAILKMCVAKFNKVVILKKPLALNYLQKVSADRYSRRLIFSPEEPELEESQVTYTCWE